jgi:hypothetical protein
MELLINIIFLLLAAWFAIGSSIIVSEEKEMRRKERNETIR